MIGLTEGGSIPPALFFSRVLIPIVLLLTGVKNVSTKLSVRKNGQKGEDNMKKRVNILKMTALSSLETIWALGTGSVAGALST